MAEFTRLIVAHDTSRIDVVVASDQPLAALLPRIVDLFALGPGAGPFALVRPIGDSLDMARDCDENELADGEIVRLVDWADAPAPPAVSDVTDAVAGLRAGLPGAWAAPAQRIVSAGAVAVLCLVAGLVVPWGTLDGRGRAGVLCGVVALLALLAIPVARVASRWAGVVLCAAATGLCLPAGLALARLVRAISPAQADVLAVMLAWWAVAAVGIGLGLRHKPGLVGGVICGVIAALGLVLAECRVRPDAVWGVVGVVAVVALGLAPTWAISASGLTGLDDFTFNGEPVSRQQVAVSTADAYATVAWCAIGTAVLVGVSAWLMVDWRRDHWTLAMAGVLIVLLALRTRALPTAVPVAVLWATVLVGALGVLWDLPVWWRLGGVLVLVVVAAAALPVRVPAHVGIRARGWANGLDKVALAASVPVLVGVFGLYAHLVGAFS